MVKIGFSLNPSHREKTLQSEEPDVFFESIFEGSLEDEEELHKRYAHKRVRGEWFDLTPDEIREISDIKRLSLARAACLEFSQCIRALDEDRLLSIIDSLRLLREQGEPISIVEQKNAERIHEVLGVVHDFTVPEIPISEDQFVDAILKVFAIE